MSGRKRSLYRASLAAEPSIQEQGVKELVALALRDKDAQGEIDALWQLLQQPPPPKATWMLCSAVCQGLLQLALKQRLDPGEAVKRLLEAMEVALRADEDPDVAFGAKAALVSLASPYLVLYASTLAKLCIITMSAAGADAAFQWAERPPLATALGLHPTKMASAVLEEVGFSRLAALPPRPQVTMPALACPVICSVIFQPQLSGHRPQLLQCLSLLPFEYVPEEAVHALALSWVSLLPFLPCRTTEDMAFWSDWAKLVFRALCHTDTPACVEEVGRPLASCLVRQALEQAQGRSAGGLQASLLPLLVLLERLADYSPALVAESFGLIAYLCDSSPAGDERAALLSVLERCVGAASEAGLRPAHLRWAAGPLLQLASREDIGKSNLLGTVLSSAGPTEPQGDDVWTRPASASLPSLEREALTASAASGPQARRWALFLLSSRLLEADSPDRERLLALLEKLLEADPLAGSRALPVVLHLLNLWKGQGRLQLRLLDCLVPLGRHQLGALVVHALLRRLPLVEPPASLGREEARRLRVVMGSAYLQLSVKLFKANSRTLSKLRHLLLEGSSLGDEVDEYRLSRVQGIAEVIGENPEAGSEFIGVVQAYLTDPLPAVVAVAVDCITYLCTADCLDYLAAVRILSKKGRLAHRDHPLVLANLADLYGAAAYVFDCSPAVEEPGTEDQKGGEGAGGEDGTPQGGEEEEEEEARPRLSDRHLVLLTDKLWALSACQDQPEVRARAYRALVGFAAALLASEEEGVAEGLRSRLLTALREERDAVAREGLGELLGEVLRLESQDAATWGRALLKAGGAQDTAAKPSRKTMKSLPTAAEVLAMYRTKSSAGAAGACLHAVSAEPSAVPALMDVLVDALSDEDGGGRCIIQRLISAQGFLRFLPPLLEQLSKAKQPHLDPFAAEVAAVEEVQAAILTELRSPAARNVNNCYLALAALAGSLSPQLSHKAAGVVEVLVGALEGVASSITVDVAVLALALGMAGRCLDASQGKHVLSLFTRLSQAGEAFGGRTDLEWCLWGAGLAMGALTDWVRQLYSPDLSALLLLSGASRACLSVLQQRLRSSALAAMVREEGATFSVQAMQQSAALGTGPLVAWTDIDVAPLEPPSSSGDDLQAVGACYALSLIVANLGHAGLERQVVQVYHVARAAVQAGLAGAEVTLAAAAALGVRASLLESEEVFGAFRLLTARVDGGLQGESLLLALANLVVGVRGSLTLPAGFVDDVKARLLSVVRDGSASEGGGGGTGSRIAALLAVYTLLGNGGPTFSLLQASVGEGFSPDRKTAAVTASLVEALKTGLASSSQRFANACARVLGLLVALRTEGAASGGEGPESSSRGPGMSTAQIDLGSLGLPAEGTLAREVVQELVGLAVGDLSGVQAASEAGRDFIVSALTALASCPVLRFSHKQVTQLLQNYVKASTDRVLVAACVGFAVSVAPRDSAYATWLYDVAVNASARPTVLDVVVEHLGDVASLMPSGLLHRTLGTVWSHLWAKPAPDRYARAVIGLTSLAKALGKAAATTSSSQPGVWAFVEGDVWPLGLVAPLAYDLQAALKQQESSQTLGPDSCLAVVEALCLVLARFPPNDVMGLLLGGGSGAASSSGLFPSLVLCLLVERRALPYSSLKPLLHRLVGPSPSSSPPAFAPLVVPFLLRAMLTAEAVGVQAGWVLELLDFLQVQPGDLRPLFVLAHLLHGWHATWYRLLLEPTARHDWAACRDSYGRMTAAAAAGQGLRCDDWAVLDEALAWGVAAHVKRLGGEAEVELLARVVRVLGAALPRDKGRGALAAWRMAHDVRPTRLTASGLLIRCMMRVVEGARAGEAVATGALPTVRVLVTQYCIAAAVRE